MTENLKLTKTVVLDYDLYILTLVALDHLRDEYKANQAKCEEMDMTDDLAYWAQKLIEIAAAYAIMFNGKLDVVEIYPATVTQ